jgi:hypothetical protein
VDHKDFLKYLEIVKEPFAIYPAPQGNNQTENQHFRTARFSYVDHSPTHVRVTDIKTEKSYDLPMVLVEFVNPGVMRLTRAVAPLNGSFV